MTSNKLHLRLIGNKSICDWRDLTQEQAAGFVKNKSYVWIVHGSTLKVISTESGSKIAKFNFNRFYDARDCVLTCVEEIDYLPEICVLAVVIELTGSVASTGMLSLFCIQGSNSNILGSMEFKERITCCRYIHRKACASSLMRSFQGAVVIGTEHGKLFLVDLMLPSRLDKNSFSSYESKVYPCFNILPNVDQDQITASHKKVAAEAKTFFSVQLEVPFDSGAVLSILLMPNLYTMAVGLNDGRMVLYDLLSLQAFHVASPPCKPAPLTHMSFLEPSDNPRCVVHVWAFHSSPEGAIAVMHSLMFANKTKEIYDNFKYCCSELTMPMFVKGSFPICCHSFKRFWKEEESTMNILAWTVPETRHTYLMIFDLNQWYKEETPSFGDCRLKLKYVAVFELENCKALDVIVKENSVVSFDSVERPEEHFFPNSLSFDVCVLENDKIKHMRWSSIQNHISRREFDDELNSSSSSSLISIFSSSPSSSSSSPRSTQASTEDQEKPEKSSPVEAVESDSSEITLFSETDSDIESVNSDSDSVTPSRTKLDRKIPQRFNS